MIVGLTSPGHMGTGIGGVLVRGGATVLVDLDGRSEASRARAREAGLTAVGSDDLADVDVLLSLSPPGIAVDLAAKLAPILRRGASAPLYLDANAVAPETARRMAATVAASGVAFCDGCVIGLPPGTAATDATLYVSGPDTAKAEQLGGYGLRVVRIDDRVGSASALKMCYAGVTKGLIALGAAMIGNAEREGVGDALLAELGASQAHLLSGFRRSLPDMVGKAGRWVAEMHEIAGTCSEGSPEAGVYEDFATFYESLAGRGRDQVAAFERFFQRSASTVT